MKELQLEVRIFFHGEFENSATHYVEIPMDTVEDDEMKVIMTELNQIMFDEYGDYEEWEDGNITWTLNTWEVINENV